MWISLTWVNKQTTKQSPRLIFHKKNPFSSETTVYNLISKNVCCMCAFDLTRNKLCSALWDCSQRSSLH